RKRDVVRRAAVLLADDHVLRDVDEASRQVARVGRAERRVGETLTGAVGRDEVLEHRQALHEVGLDRALDDLALRVCHQTAHPRQLADLVERPEGARVDHHEDRVRLVEVLLHGVRALVGLLAPAAVSAPLVHSAMTRSLRSFSVISPRSYSRSTLATFVSYEERISSFDGGITMSFFETVMPARVA